MVMIAIPIFILAAAVGVVLAAVDGPYAHNRKLIDQISVRISGLVRPSWSRPAGTRD
jgi:hypothetical protein